MELAWTIVRAFVWMWKHNIGLIVDQRPNYHTFATLIYHWAFGIPIWFDIDDWIFEQWIYLPPLRIRWLMPLLMISAQGCIVSSEHLHREVSRYSSVVVTVPTFVDDQLFTDRPMPSTREGVRFTWMGTVFDEDSLQNIYFILRAFKATWNRLRKPLQLECLVGFNPLATLYEERLRQVMRDEFDGLPIHMNPWIPPEQIPDFLQTVHVGLYVLVNSNDFQLSKSPTKLFEYMATGRPVIATTLGEAARYIRPGIDGLVARSLEDFSEAVIHLANNPEIITEMGNQARKQVEFRYNSRAAATTFFKHLLPQIDPSPTVSNVGKEV